MSFPRKEGKAKLFKIPEVFAIELDCYENILEGVLAKGLEYLQNEDLVFGDLVKYGNGKLAIYDGEKLVNFYNNLGCRGSLHMIFQVIKNNVPIDYWNAIGYNDYGYYVWFDISPVYQEIIDNIIQEGETISTHFYYDGKKYFIIFEEADRKTIKKWFLEGPILPFIYTINRKSPNTLYMDPYSMDDWLTNSKECPENELYKIEKFHKKANFLFEYHFSK
jgi:hypothetical protein